MLENKGNATLLNSPEGTKTQVNNDVLFKNKICLLGMNMFGLR